MKRVLSIIVSMFLCFSLISCGDSSPSQNEVSSADAQNSDGAFTPSGETLSALDEINTQITDTTTIIS